MFQGSWPIVLPVTSVADSASSLRVGIRKRSIAIAKATVPSSIRPGWGSSPDHPGIVRKPSVRLLRKTQRKAVRQKTTRTAFSSKRITPSCRYSLSTIERSTLR